MYVGIVNMNKLAENLEEILLPKKEVVEIEAHSGEEGVGTKATGYVLPEMGPFDCYHCLHFKEPDCCDQKEVIADPDVPKTEDGKCARVHAHACCNEFHPKDSK